MSIPGATLDAASFLFYFLRLRLAVAFGMHYTAMPLGVVWRWRQWRQVRNAEKGVYLRGH